MRKRAFLLSIMCVLLVITAGCGFIPRIARGTIIDHRCVDLALVPTQSIRDAKSTLRIAYGHTSHGSQIIDGMNGLDAFEGGTGLYAWNNDGSGGALQLRDSPFAGADDLGAPDRTAWAAATETYLNANPDINVIIWSWCGQVGGTVEEIDQDYLARMNSLEIQFPGVRFIYMTGHLDGTGPNGEVHLRNEQIRAFCRDNGKWLFDFEDIESYDPDGNYYLDRLVTDACSYDANGNGVVETLQDDPATPLTDESDPTIAINGDRNWAIDWQNSHPGEWYDCGAAHSVSLNANRKAYAAWWLWARLAGWNP
jgi:hypothetical protein